MSLSVLIWPGAAVSLLGLGLLVYVIREATRARRQGLQGKALQARLQQLVAWNMGALAISAIGLMMVVIGILLG